MSLRGYIRLVALGLVLSACKRREQPRVTLEPAVFGAVLDSMAASGTRRMVVSPLHADPIAWLTDDSSPGRSGDSASAVRRLLGHGVPVGLARDFVAVNLQRDSLRSLPRTRLRLDMDTLPALTQAARDSILRRPMRAGPGFELYARAYPGATARVALSHVGFSPDGRQALVYFESYCGLLCAGGSFVTLRWARGEWQIVRWDQEWVS